MDNKANKHG